MVEKKHVWIVFEVAETGTKYQLLNVQHQHSLNQ